MRYVEEEKQQRTGVVVQFPDFGRIIKGLLCAFFVIATGAFAVLEYIIAFLEYIAVTSVGIILFPLSLWEGSKFMAEKLIGAIIGFFIKLLFSTICIFLMLYGFFSLAKGYTRIPFSGGIDEIAIIFLTSLLFFYLCKSAPSLAQSLLTGSPSLSATGAISAMGGAATAALRTAKRTAGIAGAAGGIAAGGLAAGAFAGAEVISQAASAGAAAKALGGTAGQQAGAFFSSIGSSAKEAVKSGGGDLVRSLLGGGGSSSRASGAGVNRHSQLQNFFTPNQDGTKKSFGQHLGSRRAAGTDAGLNYMAKSEKKGNARMDKLLNPWYIQSDKS
jgi:type IV secretion system protein TrbL